MYSDLSPQDKELADFIYNLDVFFKQHEHVIKRDSETVMLAYTFFNDLYNILDKPSQGISEADSESHKLVDVGSNPTPATK